MNDAGIPTSIVERFPASRRPLRVAVVTETWPPEVNGVAMSIARVVAGLQRRDHDIQLVRPRQRTDRRIEIHRLHPPPPAWEFESEVLVLHQARLAAGSHGTGKQDRLRVGRAERFQAVLRLKQSLPQFPQLQLAVEREPRRENLLGRHPACRLLERSPKSF